MTTRQKRAIWYHERARQIERQKATLEKHGLVEDFKNSKYTNMTWYLASKGLPRYGEN